MTAQAKFEVYNNENNLVLNESYKNLYLSRIVAGNTLPMEYISQDNDCYVYGSYLARRIDFLPEKDEIFAAVAAPVGQDCNFFIFNTVVNMRSKAYLCAAQRYYQTPNITIGAMYWGNPDKVTETGMSDTSVVPDGIDVFIFAKSKKGKQASTNAGLQVFNASGDCVYDSRFKSARIVRSSPSDRRIAAGSVWAGSLGVLVKRPDWHYEYILVGFGTKIITVSQPLLPDEYYYAPTVCMSLTGMLPEEEFAVEVLGQNEYSYLFFDVTNF